ncbi:MAG: UpxY family transcription antiterminator [Flavobacteriaceae bacterium]|jgi:transcriptional antiterminator RfaH
MALESKASMDWLVVYTKPKNEKKVALELERLGIENYCPMLTLLKQYSDRKKKVKQPLIPSYVFVRTEEKDRQKVFQVSGVVRFVFWLGKPAVVKEKEIEILRDHLKGVYHDVSFQNTQKGDLLTIPSGPFKGSEGIVERIDKNKICIRLLGLGFNVTLSKTAA